ncbi:Melanoma inhibitory activity protein 3 [Fasciola gigantica]|uniref:Melanoma inhibitory activity protein 3 n=1 Tax=Fasciola gigantica TaxID=46835 RepID=A0A504YLK9_FASGI|nr:Melanoma inhibitory activity protein 3 [Fasciola gigantica]
MSTCNLSAISLRLSLLIAIVLCYETLNRPPPAEVFCVDSNCDKRIAQVRMLKDFLGGGKLIITKNTVVDMVAKSASTEDTRVKISHNGQTYYVDATFVQEMSSPEPSSFHRFDNRDATHFDGNQTPRTITPSILPVEQGKVIHKSENSARHELAEQLSEDKFEEKEEMVSNGSVPGSSNSFRNTTKSGEKPLGTSTEESAQKPSANNVSEKTVPDEFVIQTDKVIQRLSQTPKGMQDAPTPTPSVVPKPESSQPNVKVLRPEPIKKSPQERSLNKDLKDSVPDKTPDFEVDNIHRQSSKIPNGNADTSASAPPVDFKSEPLQPDVNASRSIVSFSPAANETNEKATSLSGVTDHTVRAEARNVIIKEELESDPKEKPPDDLSETHYEAASKPTHSQSVPLPTSDAIETTSTEYPVDDDVSSKVATLLGEPITESKIERGDGKSTTLKKPDSATPTGSKSESVPTVEFDLSDLPSYTNESETFEESPSIENLVEETPALSTEFNGSETNPPEQTTGEQQLPSGKSSKTNVINPEQLLVTPEHSESGVSENSDVTEEKSLPTEDWDTSKHASESASVVNPLEGSDEELKNQFESTESVDDLNAHWKQDSQKHKSFTERHTHETPSSEPHGPPQTPSTKATSISDEKLNLMNVINTSYPHSPGLIQCIIWAANETRSLPTGARSGAPLARLVIRLHSIAEMLLFYLPHPVRNLAEKVAGLIALPLDFIIMWLLIVFGLFVVRNITLAMLVLVKPRDPTRLEYEKADEQISQLFSRLSDQEEANTKLIKLVTELTDKLQNIESEHGARVVDLQELVDASKTELCALEKQLSEAVDSHRNVEKELQLRLIEKEENITKLDTELSQLNMERSTLETEWKTKLAELSESHKKAMDDAKKEHEDLYHQAVDYYNRMKAMQPEMDRLIEARKQAEDKVTTLQAELDSLHTTFTTLKSFELALEQEMALTNQKSTNSVDQSDYMLVEGSGESDTELSKQKRDVPNEEDAKKQSVSGSCESISMENSETVEKRRHPESKLRANLSLFLDVGRLQAELTAAQSRTKGEQARAECEHELRLKLEEKLEQIERENSDLRTRCSQAEEEKLSSQTRLDVLSAYFKERELELQRDLGKHVVVSSESSEALDNFRKRNKELEAELKSLREQVHSMRRELGESERISRRQITELDKRSHENWLSARAAEHQVKELRDENTLLRQKLLEAERAILPPALRAQQVNQTRFSLPMGQLPSIPVPRPTFRNSFTPGPGHLEKRSLSGQSLTSLSSQTSMSRPEMANLPFPPPPPPPIPLPRNMSPGGLQPPFIPGLSPNRLPFPHGFPPPPPPPPPLHPTGNHRTQLSSNSSVTDPSIGRPPS